MSNLLKTLPELVNLLEVALLNEGRNDISSQLVEVDINRWTYDDSCDAAYIYLQSPRQLNIVDEKIIGIKHGETISFYMELGINLDADNHGRLLGIEIFNAKATVLKLQAAIA